MTKIGLRITVSVDRTANMLKLKVTEYVYWTIHYWRFSPKITRKRVPPARQRGFSRRACVVDLEAETVDRIRYSAAVTSRDQFQVIRGKNWTRLRPS